ncbi:LamG domain-containing protein [Streptomyces acidicola]|uniref:LamG domain-containing protein n=1 Tax=Streptomyces acidicola TaxID=2596892 RepID=UPI003437E52A
MRQYASARRIAVTCAAMALTLAATTGAATAAENDEVPAAPVITSPEYPDDDAWHDGVGNYGTFVIDSASDDVVAYRYAWMGGGWKTLTAADPGAAVSLRWLPESEGPVYLTVRAVDNSGNISAATTHWVRVREGRAAVSHWDPEDQGGAVAGDGVALDASGPSGTSAASAAELDGTDEAYLTLGSSVDTAKIFSVGAWVRPDVVDGDMTAVSQSGFRLGTSTGAQGDAGWYFALPAADGGTVRVTGGNPEEGEWAHLVGVYDTEQRTARLYVNGELVDAAEGTVAAGGTGPLRLGDGQNGGDGGDNDDGGNWDGLLTEVKFWDRVFVPKEIEDAAERTAVRQGYWNLDTAPGGKSPEYAGGEPLTLAGDASIYTTPADCDLDPFCEPMTPPLHGSGDLLLDGDGDYAETATSVTPSDAGFSLGAHVRIDEDTATHDMTVLSQPGEHTNLFTLRYLAATRTWEAVVAHEDRADAPTTTVSAPVEPTDTLDGQFLAVVYDEKADELRLYVDDVYADDTAALADADAWTPAGGLQVGRTLTADGGTDHLKGEIDEVRAYAGVLSETQLAFLRLGGIDA